MAASTWPLPAISQIGAGWRRYAASQPSGPAEAAKQDGGGEDCYGLEQTIANFIARTARKRALAAAKIASATGG